MISPPDLHADFERRSVVETATLPFEASPIAGLWCKRVMQAGGVDRGMSTSLIRYDAGATSPSHDHRGGEEILVLAGIFSDERGDFPAGTHMLHPEGFRHRTFSRSGCTLFTKLRQYEGAEREAVFTDTRRPTWTERMPGVTSLLLYESPSFPERIRLTRIHRGVAAPVIDLPEGEEIYVASGTLEDENGRYPTGTWLRMPRGSRHAPRSETGCTLYVCSGGLPLSR